jgi:hypothetical protein
MDHGRQRGRYLFLFLRRHVSALCGQDMYGMLARVARQACKDTPAVGAGLSASFVFVAAKPAPWSSVRIVLCGRSTLNSARRNAALPAYASWCY